MKYRGSIRCQKTSMGFSSIVSLAIDVVFSDLVMGGKMGDVCKGWKIWWGARLYMSFGMISLRH